MYETRKRRNANLWQSARSAHTYLGSLPCEALFSWSLRWRSRTSIPKRCPTYRSAGKDSWTSPRSVNRGTSWCKPQLVANVYLDSPLSFCRFNDLVQRTGLNDAVRTIHFSECLYDGNDRLSRSSERESQVVMGSCSLAQTTTWPRYDYSLEKTTRANLLLFSRRLLPHLLTMHATTPSLTCLKLALKLCHRLREFRAMPLEARPTGLIADDSVQLPVSMKVFCIINGSSHLVEAFPRLFKNEGLDLVEVSGEAIHLAGYPTAVRNVRHLHWDVSVFKQPTLPAVPRLMKLTLVNIIAGCRVVFALCKQFPKLPALTTVSLQYAVQTEQWHRWLRTRPDSTTDFELSRVTYGTAINVAHVAACKDLVVEIVRILKILASDCEPDAVSLGYRTTVIHKSHCQTSDRVDHLLPVCSRAIKALYEVPTRGTSSFYAVG